MYISYKLTMESNTCLIFGLYSSHLACWRNNFKDEQSINWLSDWLTIWYDIFSYILKESTQVMRMTKTGTVPVQPVFFEIITTTGDLQINYIGIPPFTICSISVISYHRASYFIILYLITLQLIFILHSCINLHQQQYHGSDKRIDEMSG